MTQVHIYWPHAWSRAKRRAPWAFVAGGVMATFFLAVGMAATSAGEYEMALFQFAAFGLFAAMMVLGCFGAFALRRKDNSAVDLVELLRTPEHAATLRYNSVAAGTYLGLMLIFSGVCAVLITVGAILANNGTWPTTFHILAWVIAPLAMIQTVGTLISRVFRKRSLLGVGMSPEGVYHWSWFGCCFFAWDTIKEVLVPDTRGFAVDLHAMESPERPENPEENWFGRLPAFRRTKLRIPVGGLTVDPAVLLYALAFYHRHPESRSELGTNEGVERIRRLEFPDVIDEVDRYGSLRPAREREREEP